MPRRCSYPAAANRRLFVTSSIQRRYARRLLPRGMHATRVASAAIGIALPVGLLGLVAGTVSAQTPVLTVVQPARVGADSTTEAQRRSAPTLRLGDLYGEVVRASPRITAAHAQVRAARARVAPATRPPDPTLQLGFMNYTVPGLRPMDPLGMTQLQLMQMIPAPGKLGLAGNVARAQADATAARADDVPWELRSRVAMAFYDLYRNDQALMVAEETRLLLQNIASVAEAMYRVGDAQQADVLRAQVESARMTEDIVRMQAMRTSAAGRLNALLNRTPDAGVGAPALPAFPENVPSLDSLNALARVNRPMLLAGEQDVRAADAANRLARREIWPDLEIGVQYGQRARTSAGGMGGGGTERMGSLMIGASVPVFARSRQLQMREEAAAMRAMSVADLEAMRADTRGQLGEAYANLLRARNLAALYRTTVLPQAQAAVTSAFASYRVGRVNLMTLLDNQMTVNRYRQELFALEAEQGTAWAEIEMLAGRQLFDPNVAAHNAAAGGDAR